LNAERRGLGPEERIRHLDEDAGAVAGVDFAAACAAMQQVDQELERLLHDRVGAPPFDMDDEPDAARITFVIGRIESLRGHFSLVAH
jgi:hypothetical protein